MKLKPGHTMKHINECAEKVIELQDFLEHDHLAMTDNQFKTLLQDLIDAVAAREQAIIDATESPDASKSVLDLITICQGK